MPNNAAVMREHIEPTQKNIAANIVSCSVGNNFLFLISISFQPSRHILNKYSKSSNISLNDLVLLGKWKEKTSFKALIFFPIFLSPCQIAIFFLPFFKKLSKNRRPEIFSERLLGIFSPAEPQSEEWKRRTSALLPTLRVRDSRHIPQSRPDLRFLYYAIY